MVGGERQRLAQVGDQQACFATEDVSGEGHHLIADIERGDRGLLLDQPGSEYPGSATDFEDPAACHGADQGDGGRSFVVSAVRVSALSAA